MTPTHRSRANTRTVPPSEEGGPDGCDPTNYDGQGKSQAQETSDSLRMLTLVLLVALLIGAVLTGLVLWSARQQPANSLANATKIGDGRTPVCVYTDTTLGVMVVPCTASNAITP